MTKLFPVFLEENFYYPHVVGEILTDAFPAQGTVDQISFVPNSSHPLQFIQGHITLSITAEWTYTHIPSSRK